MKNVTVPYGVTVIGKGCFQASIGDVVLPSSVEEIGHHAFWDTCYKENGELKGVTVMNVAVSEEDFSTLKIGDDWVPKYDYLLFKKAIDVKYETTRQN